MRKCMIKRERMIGMKKRGKESNRSLERQLSLLFQAPEPRERETFLAGRPRTSIRHVDFVLAQAAYIRKWVWVLSGAVFCLLVGMTAQWQQDSLWIASGMMPFLALLAVQEQNRSGVYGMTELELATRFSLKSVVLARMGLLGGFHLALLGLLLPLLVGYGQTGILRTGVYLLVPYLLTTFLSLVWSRKVRGREILFLCLGTAVLVSSLQMVGRGLPGWYGERFFRWWLLVLALLAAGNGWEYYQAACRADRAYEIAG